MAGEATRKVDAGDIRSCRNHTGSSIPANTVVMLTTTEDHISIISATTDPIYGVTMDAAIPDHEYGDVQIRGEAKCRATGALATPGILVMGVAATGRVDTWAAGGGTNAAVVGSLLSTAGAQDDIVNVELAGPGVFKQG